MGSSRLPGKVLAPVEGEPLLGLLLKRLRRATTIGDIVVATTTSPDDDPVAGLSRRLGARIVRGDRDDVLSRYVQAIDWDDYRGPVIRITGDCPLIDPAIIDKVAGAFWMSSCRYASNIQVRRYPDGLDVEMVDAAVLRELAKEKLTAAEREHVTLGVRARPKQYPAVSVIGHHDLSTLRWTVDSQADLDLIRSLVRMLGDRRYSAGWREILAAHTALGAAPTVAPDRTAPQ